MNLKIILDRVNQLIELSIAVGNTRKVSGHGFESVSNELFINFRTASLSFLQGTFGIEHPYYREFDAKVIRSRPEDTRRGRGILSAVKDEFEAGWLSTIKGLVSADIFSDFLEMADHLLTEGYKDPAAVMIGSVLEGHLRHLCEMNGIPLTVEKAGDAVVKKADALNADLARDNAVYGKLDQKNVTAWLDLRNKAAHGQYEDYTASQVQLMLQGVMDFIARHTL